MDNKKKRRKAPIALYNFIFGSDPFIDTIQRSSY